MYVCICACKYCIYICFCNQLQFDNCYFIFDLFRYRTVYIHMYVNVVFRSSSKNPEDVLYIYNIKYKMYRYRSSRYLCVQMISLVLMWKKQLYCTNPLIFLYIQGYTSNQMVPVFCSVIVLVFGLDNLATCKIHFCLDFCAKYINQRRNQ